MNIKELRLFLSIADGEAINNPNGELFKELLALEDLGFIDWKKEITGTGLDFIKSITDDLSNPVPLYAAYLTASAYAIPGMWDNDPKEYNVWISSFPKENKTRIVAAIRKHINISLKEVFDKLNTLPFLLGDFCSEEKKNSLQEEFSQLGCAISIETH
jgi:ribosomal protein L7/L12